MQRRALLCAEAGGGFGHITTLSRLGALLLQHGWTVRMVAPQASRFPGEVPAGLACVEGERWGHALPKPPSRTGSSASLGDTLADLGLRDIEAIRDQITYWHLCFSDFFPDLVVADFAPGAVLAARGRVQTLVVGNGFTVPPPQMPVFPALHHLAPIRESEGALCDNVNTVLAEGGVRPIERLPEVLGGDARSVFTYPLLDPYREHRSEAVLGVLAGEAVRAAGPGGDVFVYYQFGDRQDRLLRLLAALRRLRLPVRAYLPGAPAAHLDWLADCGAVIETRPVPLSQIVRSRLLVHHGSHGFAALGLIAGIPQVALGWDIEKDLNGKAVESAGAGLERRIDHVCDEEVEAAIRQVLGEVRFADAARAVAADLASFAGGRAEQAFVETVRRLAGPAVSA